MASAHDVDRWMDETYPDSTGVVERAKDPRNDAPEWLIDYVLDIRDRLGLRDWSLWIIVADLGGTYAGTCEVVYGRRLATIKLDKSSVAGSATELRATVVHELLHCHAMPVNWAFNSVGKQVNPSVFTALQDGFVDAQEQAIDNMAMAWATLLPLPEVPDEEEEAA